MNVQTITMPKLEAWNAYQQYRAALKKRHNTEDEVLTRAYRAMAKERRVLDIISVIRQGGADAEGRPKLAIVRANVNKVYCRVERNGAVRFSVVRSPQSSTTRNVLRFPPGTIPQIPNDRWWIDCEAVVPIVPIQYRPSTSLGNYHLLWEADWQDIPKDPILLKWLGTNLYAVLAQWELTPLERAILNGRR